MFKGKLGTCTEQCLVGTSAAMFIAPTTPRRHPTRAAACAQAPPAWAPIYMVMWFSTQPFVYESFLGGAAEAPAGRSAMRVSTLAQALALGRRVEQAAGIEWSVYKLDDGTCTLKASFPKRVNVGGAKVKFRRRRAKDGSLLDGPFGVGGMGDDVWRELLERENWGSIDDAWVEFRKSLELTRELEIIDSSTGEKVDFGPIDYPPELTDMSDDVYD